MDFDDNKFYLEHDQLPEDTSSEYNYETIPIEDVLGFGTEENDDWVANAKILQEAAQDEKAAEVIKLPPKASLKTRPPSMDDFVRSFLLKLGMTRTLDCFQVEWFERQQKGLLNAEDVSEVPDIYVRNQELDDELKVIRSDRNKYKEAASKAREMYVKLRNERDFHRLNHRRVAQEKNKLLNDLKRLKEHYSSYEPALQQMRRKYEVAMKEKMLSQLERDQAMGQVQGLRSTLRSLENFRPQGSRAQSVAGYAAESSRGTTASIHQCKKGGELIIDNEGRGPTQKRLVEERRKADEAKDMANLPDTYQRYVNDSEFPVDHRVNPQLNKVKGPPGHLTRSGGFKLSQTIKAHESAVSGVALHPTKPVLCTTGDDHCWKLWSVPAGELLMTGTGHEDWLSSADFHPDGQRLATSSGDSTVKIWDFKQAECVYTFSEHTHAVWAVSWHTCGHFLASASMDNTVKLWDLNSLRCRYTMRGHSDSVNSVEFLPYSNTLLSCSADKVVALWDARTGICGQTLCGHLHSINYATLNPRGDTIVSCDSFGFVRFWDVRTGRSTVELDLGPHPANYVKFDLSGSCVAVASNDSNVKMVEVATNQMTMLSDHEDAVQACIFDPSGDFLVSCSSDQTAKIWS